MHRHAGSIHFALRLALPQNAERCGADRDLDLKIVDVHSAEADFRIGADADHVGEIQFHFGARVGAGQDVSVGHERSVERGRHDIAGIAAPDRNVSIEHADAGHPAARFILAVRARLAGCPPASWARQCSASPQRAAMRQDAKRMRFMSSSTSA